MKKEPLFFVKHIKLFIENIEVFSESLKKEEFKKDDLRQSAIIRKIEIIGEAVKNLPASFLHKYPSVEWKKITGTRDKLIHQYFGIDLDLMWDVLKTELPKLKKQIKEILRQEEK
ncbi:MAG TPA: DUF86 domain-containing protein [Candidatus Nanoarchaeia archaeon]|nr:DUF86 domain-containing protein [Candidatus Nanoarchaeia archaeon]